MITRNAIYKGEQNAMNLHYSKMHSNCAKVFCVLIFTLIADVKSRTIINAPKVSEGNADWWKHAVFYQIYPRSFKDSNNDGIGDLQGIITKLNHLKDAGITATWLSPIYKSPQVDAGYDISDFMDIDEDYGTLDDFDQLITKARELGIKIIMDFVPNHSSNEHEWFIKSEKNESGYKDLYIWKNGNAEGGPPNNWLSIFKYSAWKYSTIREQYYLHQFAEAQPDLNYRDPVLVQNMKEVLKFWLDKGVDGFRMDAVPYLFEDDKFEDEPFSNVPGVPEHEHGYLKHIYTSDQPETFDMIYQWREFLDEYTRENGGDARIMMTEAYTDIENTMLYYGNGDREGAHFTFNFQFITKLSKSSTAKDTIAAIEEWLTAMPTKYTANWVMGNHDNHRVATKFGLERVDGVNMLIALLPGVMVTYNGEEIGQENGEVTWEQGQDPGACNGNKEDFEKSSRDFERTPFHWNDSVNGGFNEGHETWLPVSSKYTTTNLAAQRVFGKKSHYQVYQSLLKLRQESAFVQGSLNIVPMSDNVLAFTREIAKGTSYVVVINIGNKEETVDLSGFTVLNKNIKVVLTNDNSSKQNRVLQSNQINLEAYESFVAKVIPDVQEGESDWWKHAVFYQIYPRSFKDDTNDGIGDLKGIISKLDHLKDAGITATWLSPIYKSPQVDAGYDISDFMDIDEDYGTLDDFEQLITKARELGIKIIMDFVPNHSSNEHEWFLKSERREPGYENLYIWKDAKPDGGPPNNWLSIFKYSAWEYSIIRKQYYYHQFAIAQPDLNYRDPVLVQKMKEVLEFWLDRGVDGFRMDAVPYLFEDEEFEDEPLSNAPGVPEHEHGYLKHIYTSDQPETFDMIYQWREFLDEYTRENGGDARIMMTEAYTDIENTMLYYGNGDREGAHFTFNFQFVTKLNKSSTAKDTVDVIEEWLTAMPTKYTANWVMGNHDNHRVATKFGPERVDGVNMLIALLPGVMVTYNGEEIGQENGEVTWEQGQDPGACNGNEEDFEKSSRDFERTPFHWNTNTNAGFNEGHPPWLPVSSKYRDNNLLAQQVVGLKSHYRIYQYLLKLRQEPAFVKGSLNIYTLSDNVFVFTRELEGNPSYVVVINIGSEEEIVDLSTIPGLKKQIKVVIANEKSSKLDRILPSYNIKLAPYESFVAQFFTNVQEGDLDWWKHAVFYQIYPRSFKDDTNDGIGDLKGIISKLDHLKDAGVTATWLSPIYKSPQVDAGYDISDFMDIDEDYGTLEDFDDLVKKARELGIKIIMDFVPNHSSNEHEWFLKSENREAGYEDLYIWKDVNANGGPPNNWLSIFKYSAWKYSTIRKQYYLHQFAEAQPDLNYRDPVLVQNMKDVLKFWLDKGVDGFRMDAVPYLFEDEKFEDEPLSNAPGVPEHEHGYLKHIYTSDQPETFDMIYQWREFLNEYTMTNGGDARIMMTEAYTDIKNTMLYYGDGDRNGAHFTFNFQFITKVNKNSTARNIVEAINEWLAYMPLDCTANWVIGNHDNHRAATKFGPERADGMNMLVALLPGVMVTYNGEEIGQENGEVTWQQGQDPGACNGAEEDFETASRDFERTPFHWNNSTNAGFNTGFEPWLPVSPKYKENNLAAQKIYGIKSHYHIYQNLLKLRQEPAFVNGTIDVVALSDTVLAFKREVPDNDTFVVVLNIGNKEETVDLSYFSVLKKNVKVVATNEKSKKQDRVLSSNNIQLVAYESIVVKALPDVEEGNHDWWKHAVFYQIYPRSFKDDTNDGIGDLKGIISKLDHLKDAGVTATWLSPIYKSPQVDAGYDISDFMDIDEDYGTLEDFDNLVKKARELGIKIIMDFVPNHSSNEHEWFIKSEKREAGYEDLYIWRDGKPEGGPPNNWISRFKYSAWEYSEIRKQYYYHEFVTAQPDLNYRSPVLVQNMKDVLRFWMDRGVDGFRMDAVPYLFEDDQFLDEPLSNTPGVSEDEHGYLKHIYTEDQPGTFEMIYEWRTYLEDYTKEHGGDARIMMTEAYTDMNNTMYYYGNGEQDGAHFTFNFQLITELNPNYKAEDIVNAINEWIINMPSKYTANWVLGNHDQNRTASRFGPENADGFNMLIALLPGVMVTYNGEEIGQENGAVTWEQGEDPSACNGPKDDFNKTSRDFARTPFHWDDSVNGGFNEGFEPWLPVSSKYTENNLKVQSDADSNSHYQIYKNLLKLRNEATLLGGDLKMQALSDTVLGLIRSLEGKSTYVFLFNTGDKAEVINVPANLPETITHLEIVLRSNASPRKKGDVVAIEGLKLDVHESIIATTTKDPGGSATENTKISFFMVFITVICTLFLK